MNSNNLTMLRDFNRNASNINMPEVFEENVYKIIDITSIKYGTSVQYILPGLIATTSSWLQKSKIALYRTLNFYMSEYCLLVAYPSCYPVNDICKQAINRIEQYFNSPLADHTVRQPITNPAVMCALHENPVILACHGDEFLSTFAQDYELRNTLTFLSATPENAFYHTKTKTNIIKAPRYNLSAVCNIVQAIKIGNAYKASNSDTSFTKMLVSTPPAPKCLAQQIREACSQETTELHSIFMLLRKLHNTERSFSLSEGANNIFDTYFDKFSQIIEKILPVDSYLAAILSNNIAQITRLGAIIHSINYAVTKLQNQPVSHREKITGELEDIIDKIVCQTSIAEFNISQKTMEQAINLIDYFNKHMLLISNYNLSDCSIEEFIDKTINNSSN